MTEKIIMPIVSEKDLRGFKDYKGNRLVDLIDPNIVNSPVTTPILLNTLINDVKNILDEKYPYYYELCEYAKKTKQTKIYINPIIFALYGKEINDTILFTHDKDKNEVYVVLNTGTGKTLSVSCWFKCNNYSVDVIETSPSYNNVEYNFREFLMPSMCGSPLKYLLENYSDLKTLLDKSQNHKWVDPIDNDLIGILLPFLLRYKGYNYTNISFITLIFGLVYFNWKSFFNFESYCKSTSNIISFNKLVNASPNKEEGLSLLKQTYLFNLKELIKDIENLHTIKNFYTTGVQYHGLHLYTSSNKYTIFKSVDWELAYKEFAEIFSRLVYGIDANLESEI